MLVPAWVAWCRERKALLHTVFFILLAGVVVMAARRSLFGPFDFTWLSALYAMLILITMLFPDARLSRMLSHRLLVWFGGVSFAIYMFHEAVAGLTHYVINGYDHPSIRGWGDLAVTLLSFAITCGLAHLSGRYFEKPFRDYGHRVTYAQGNAINPDSARI
jgi:peptidoglycan/LPS O-acetylase OafA/YrhL